MSDSDRFAGLKKLPRRSVAEILAETGGELDDDGIALDQPPEAVLAALDANGDIPGQIRLLARALPRREGIWWACLAGRDLQPEGRTWQSLQAAEDWVFKPGPATRKAALDAANAAAPEEESDLCARAAYFVEPTKEESYIGPGMAPLMVELMVLKSYLSVEPVAMEVWGRHLIDRGLDIARGGNGTSLPAPELPTMPEEEADEADEENSDVTPPAQTV